jgi:hypothetical protein
MPKVTLRSRPTVASAAIERKFSLILSRACIAAVTADRRAVKPGASM